MKVNVEVQYICYPIDLLSGIPYYVINLIKALAQRKDIDLSVSFFDQFKERNNSQYVEEHLGKEILCNLQVQECNTQSYRPIQDESKFIDNTEFSGFDANDRGSLQNCL